MVQSVFDLLGALGTIVTAYGGVIGADYFNAESGAMGTGDGESDFIAGLYAQLCGPLLPEAGSGGLGDLLVALGGVLTALSQE